MSQKQKTWSIVAIVGTFAGIVISIAIFGFTNIPSERELKEVDNRKADKIDVVSMKDSLIIHMVRLENKIDNHNQKFHQK